MKSVEKRCTSPKVFINSPLSHIGAQILNNEIKKILVREGFDCILPQEILPPGPNAGAREVFEVNLKLLEQCDTVLSVLDAPGEGVIFELGVAAALGKPVVAFRSDKQRYLGKVVEGFWLSLPKSQKAESLEELRCKLREYRNSWSEMYEKSKIEHIRSSQR